MTIYNAIGRQLRHPMGIFGWSIGHLMRRLNARSNVLAIAALNIQGDEDILELGCGPGYAVKLIAAQAPRCVIHAIDQSDTMLAQSRSRNRDAIQSGRVHLYHGRFEELPFPNQSIDKILAVNVAYFWSDPQQVLREVRRVLRPGGMLSIYVTDSTTMRRWKFAGAETHRLYNRDSLARMLDQGGFKGDPVKVIRIQMLHGVTGLIAVAEHP